MSPTAPRTPALVSVLLQQAPGTWPADVEGWLHAQIGDGDAALRLQNPGIPVDLLIAAAASPHVAWREASAGNPATPDHVRDRLVRDRAPRVRTSAALAGAVPVWQPATEFTWHPLSFDRMALLTAAHRDVIHSALDANAFAGPVARNQAQATLLIAQIAVTHPDTETLHRLAATVPIKALLHHLASLADLTQPVPFDRIQRVWADLVHGELFDSLATTLPYEHQHYLIWDPRIPPSAVAKLLQQRLPGGRSLLTSPQVDFPMFCAHLAGPHGKVVEMDIPAVRERGWDTPTHLAALRKQTTFASALCRALLHDPQLTVDDLITALYAAPSQKQVPYWFPNVTSTFPDITDEQLASLGEAAIAVDSVGNWLSARVNAGVAEHPHAGPVTTRMMLRQPRWPYGVNTVLGLVQRCLPPDEWGQLPWRIVPDLLQAGRHRSDLTALTEWAATRIGDVIRAVGAPGAEVLNGLDGTRRTIDDMLTTVSDLCADPHRETPRAIRVPSPDRTAGVARAR